MFLEQPESLKVVSWTPSGGAAEDVAGGGADDVVDVEVAVGAKDAQNVDDTQAVWPDGGLVRRESLRGGNLKAHLRVRGHNSSPYQWIRISGQKV